MTDKSFRKPPMTTHESNFPPESFHAYYRRHLQLISTKLRISPHVFALASPLRIRTQSHPLSDNFLNENVNHRGKRKRRNEPQCKRANPTRSTSSFELFFFIFTTCCFQLPASRRSVRSIFPVRASRRLINLFSWFQVLIEWIFSPRLQSSEIITETG